MHSESVEEVNLEVDAVAIPACHVCAAGETVVVVSLKAVCVPLRHAWEVESQSCHHCGSGAFLVMYHHYHACVAAQLNQMRYVTVVAEGKMEHVAELVDADEELTEL